MPVLKIESLRLPVNHTHEDVSAAVARRLSIAPGCVKSIKLLKKSLDARKKNSPGYIFTVAADISGTIPNIKKTYGVFPYIYAPYTPPVAAKPLKLPPVVVGAGPAGLFCALILARAGLKPVLVERGAKMERRVRDVDAFFNTGILNTCSNVQFGEGGAGAFSDGKLTTGTKNPCHDYILRTFIEFGAPEDIAYLAKPHIGTDYLRRLIPNIRQEIINAGGTVLFGTVLEGLDLYGGRVIAARLNGKNGSFSMETNHIVYAGGHSARDTVAALYNAGIPMEQKDTACGVRIEHLQRDIDAAQYGTTADFKNLPASDYKLSFHAGGSRSAYTFCVCPGGSVVGAASENGGVVTNGMSNYARDLQNINGALLVSLHAGCDYGSSHPLAGFEFMRRLERAAFELGGGTFAAPAQTVGDFLAGRPANSFGRVKPSYKPAVTGADIRQILPEFIAGTLMQAIPEFGKKIRGFNHPEAVLTAVETRSSSPVRIVRGKDLQSPKAAGFYPCGEGAGYAGGIMSAAADGVKCAEAIILEGAP